MYMYKIYKTTNFNNRGKILSRFSIKVWNMNGKKYYKWMTCFFFFYYLTDQLFIFSITPRPLNNFCIIEFRISFVHGGVEKNSNDVIRLLNKTSQ